MQEHLSQRQALDLIGELESATKLLDLGIGELHALGLASDFYDLPLQLLAQGLERFLKVTYAMAELGRAGTLPSPAQMKRYGHDLQSLTDDLVQIVSTSKACVRRPAVQEDMSFVRSSTELRAVLAHLGDFGKRNRYYR